MWMQPASPRFDDDEGMEDLGSVLDNDSMSSSTVLSKMLFKPTSVVGRAAKDHLVRAVVAYNTAIGIQTDGGQDLAAAVESNSEMQVCLSSLRHPCRS